MLVGSFVAILWQRRHRRPETAKVLMTCCVCIEPAWPDILTGAVTCVVMPLIAIAHGLQAHITCQPDIADVASLPMAVQRMMGTSSCCETRPCAGVYAR